MIEKITDQNLERYDSRLKEWCDRKFFEKGNYGKYQTTEEAGAVAFYPAPNTPLEGKVKFSFKETMPAEGVKGPDNPSTITGVSSVKVTRCGKNLIKYPYTSGSSYTNRGYIITTTSDGVISINGESDNVANCHYQLVGSYGFHLCGGVSYTACLFSNVLNSEIILQGFDSSGTIVFTALAGDTAVTFVPQNDINITIRITIFIAAGNLTNAVIYPQLELNPIATTFESYADNDYTISLGNTYYGGEISLATGLMTVIWAGEQVSQFESVSTVYTNTVTCFVNSLASHGGHADTSSSVLVCNRFPVFGGESDVPHCRFVGNPNTGNKRLNFYVPKSLLDVSEASDPSSPTNEEWLAAANAWIGSNALVIAYKRFFSYEVQLTPIQIFSLTQQDKYTPRLNTVYTDADSVQISYLKSPIRDEYEKTQAILSLGGNS